MQPSDPVEIRSCQNHVHGPVPRSGKWWCVRVFGFCVSNQLTETRAKRMATLWRNLLTKWKEATDGQA